jgi:hypothetical protein
MARDAGLLLNAAANFLRFMPALNVTQHDRHDAGDA